MIVRRPLGKFLRLNPFANGLTDGLFYREKMRAIHRVAPHKLNDDACILEVGGGRSGLAAMLYPGASVITIDSDATLESSQPDLPNTKYLVGDACALPFAEGTFDVVTLFDVLEHIEDDRKAASEALRVTKRSGVVLISTPHESWRYPSYRLLRQYCPHENDLMREWGHVRRGYTPDQVSDLFGRPIDQVATFINQVTAFYHDISFSRFKRRIKRALYAAAALPTAIAYGLHRQNSRGSEFAARLRIIDG